MKKLLLVVFIILGTLSLAACKVDVPVDPVDPVDPVNPVDPVDPVNRGERIDFGDQFVEKTTIRVWMDDESGEYMEALIAEFNKVHPNIIIEHQHMGSVESREMLKTFGPSGNGADVFQFPHDHLAQAVLEDLVYPLPVSTLELLQGRSHPLGLGIATLTFDEAAESFDPTSPNAVERLYAVPMSIESVGLFYNKDMITTPAATYEELFASADIWNAVTEEGGNGLSRATNGVFYLGTSSNWADSYFMQHVYSAFGFFPFGPNLNNPAEVGFDSDETIAALNWIKTELQPRVTGTGAHDSVSGGANFEQGLIPYVIAGPWNHGAFQEAGLNYGVAPLPTINGNATKSFAGAMMAAVYKYSDNLEEATKFVEFLSSDEAMTLLFEYQGKLPALETSLLVDIEGVNQDALLMAMAEQLGSAIPMPTIPQVTFYWGPGGQMLTDVWNLGIDVATAAAAAEASYRARVGLAG